MTRFDWLLLAESICVGLSVGLVVFAVILLVHT